MRNFIRLIPFLIQCIYSKTIWQSYEFDSGVGNREEIFVEKIIAQQNIPVNGKIRKWKSGVNCPEYALGIAAQEIKILHLEPQHDNDTVRINIIEIELQLEVADTLIFSHYNYHVRTNETILIVATRKEDGSEIKWYKMDGNSKINPEPFWSWNTENHVIHMTYSVIENKLILIQKNSDGDANIDIVKFSIEGRCNFSIIQSIPLESPTHNTALNFDGNAIFLSLPQVDHVRILKYHQHTFIPYKNITCTFVEHVTGFHIGVQSYLAIDGWNAGIYQFTRRTLVKQEVAHGHLEGTNYWLPIPVSNFHHEDILLVQKNISHGTFDSLMLEVVSKDGVKFSFHEETVCDYLGDDFVGLNCITDENHSLGIKNAAVLSNGDSKAVVLSHSDGTTTIFKINIGFREVSSPVNRQIQELQANRRRMEETIQTFRIENRASSHLIERTGSDESDSDIVKQNPPLNWNLKPEKLVDEMGIEALSKAIAAVDRMIQENAVLLENRRVGRFDTIVINGLLEVHGYTRIRSIETNKDFENQINDIARIDGISNISGHKTFTDLQTQNLTFETVNGVDASAIKYKKDLVKIIGDITFEKPLIINGNMRSQDGLLSGIDFKANVVFVKDKIDDIIHFNDLRVADTFSTKSTNKLKIHNNYLNAAENQASQTDNLDELVFESLYLPGNLTVKYVNDKDLDEFVQSLCFRNLKTYVPGTVNITGKTTLIGKSTTTSLNSLKFPEDYVLNDSEEFTRFTGEKHFRLVQANEATTTYLNDFEPDSLVTLSQDQDINGKLIFDNLQIAESISVGGQVTGSKQNVFIPNPTMVETNHILANVNFKSLIVEGNIVVLDSFNNSKFEEKMSSVIYKDLENMFIVNSKKFLNGITVEKNLEVASNLINQVNINDLVSKLGNGELNLKNITGKIDVQNLQVQGLVNNCNITKLDRETVKLSGDQFLTSQFAFADEVLVSNTLDIRDSINNLTEFDLLFNDGNRILAELDLEEVFAERIIIEKDIQVEIKDFNLNEFEANRLSYSKDQHLSGSLETAHVEASVMNASVINDHFYYDLFTNESVKNKILNMFFSGKLAVQNLIVEETLNISSINEVDVNELFSKCIWNAGVNVYKEPLVFLNNVYCNNLIIKNFNSVPFESFVSNIVFKNETNVTFGGLKNYLNGLHIKNYIETKFINDIKINNVLRKNGEQTIRSPIEILGDVVIENADVGDSLNGVPANQLIDSFERISHNTIKINGDVLFTRFATIDSLDVEGFVNGVNITNKFNDMVSVKEDVHFMGTTVFEDFVHVKGNMDVLGNVNEVDMEQFNENVVCISNDAEFEDVVTFGEHVTILQKLYIETDFVSRFVDGIDMQSWLDNAVFINKGIIPGSVSFDHAILNGNVLTKFVNDLNMSTLIPLRTDQILDVKLMVDSMDVFGEIDVGSLVNGVRLESEVSKSVLVDRENTISSEIIFENNVVVREEFNIASMVNDKDPANIITTDTDQIIHRKLIFLEEVILERGLATGGLLNDINLTDWEGRGLKKSVPYVQHLAMPIIAEKVIFDGSVIGAALVNEMDARTLADQVEGKKLMKSEIEEKLINSYPNVCADVNLAQKLAKQQLYSFDYLEEARVIEFESNIELLFNFQYQGTHYLLVHEQNTCVTNIFSWSKNKFYFTGQVETGSINQIILIPDRKVVFFVARSDFAESLCNMAGSNIWQFEPEDITIKAIFNIGEQILLQESQIPDTFYGLLRDGSITEYQLSIAETITLKKYRKWSINTDNLAFVPRGLNTGIALTDGTNIYRLMKDDLITNNDGQLGFESILIGRILVENNTIFPGRMNGESVVLKTGEYNKNLMVALTNTIGGEMHNNIKIYDDWKKQTFYQEIQAINPSSLMTINFENNGECYLYFLEDNRQLRMFEYKGILGFLERVSLDIEGTDLMQLELTNENNQANHFIAIIDKNRMKLYRTKMRGSNISSPSANCEL